ncbi:hypothetical protein LguiA_010245 [Lonicera macranthoides]
MGSITKPKLPLIDFTEENLKPGSTSWLKTGKNVQAALEEYGCFVAVFDKVSPALRNGVLDATKEMFDLPEETKKRNISKMTHFGYLGKEFFPNRLHFESLGIEKATIAEDVKYFTHLMWPSGNDNFCETMHSYANTLSELEQMVTKMMFERYDVDKYYDSHKESNEYLLRYIIYGGVSEDEKVKADQIHGAPPHTDRSLLTILYQNDVGINPLEIVTKYGDSIAVEIPPSSYVVMAGDALTAWSNGRIRAAEHKVQMSGNKTRYSVALFSHSKGIVEVPKELVDDQHPRQFNSFDNFGLLRFSLTEEGRKADNIIKAYCGV